jgi:F-type H+-transporting ATPase subunit gamma
MASLKEVKGRINSINGTLKITSAMKMVASSKLHKAQEAIENMLPYERRLYHMLTNFLKSDVSVESPFIVKREVKKVAIVVFASNSSLCGGFNANVIRHLTEMINQYAGQVGKENILVYPDFSLHLFYALMQNHFPLELFLLILFFAYSSLLLIFC